MKTLICPETSRVHLIQIDTPTPAEGELLVRVTSCGVCGTDILKIYAPQISKPVAIGHEIVATIEVSRAESFQAGQQVIVAHHAPCYVCHYCRHGNYSMCETFKRSNIFPGGFSEFVRVPADLVTQTVIPVPSNLSEERAVFAEPLACCVRALQRVPSLQQRDSALVVGAGSIGLMFLALLGLQHVRSLVFDLRADRLQNALSWGAELAVNPAETDALAAARTVSEGRGVDLVILTVANAATLRQAISTVRDGGTILIFGAKMGGDPAPADLWEIYRRELTLLSSYSASPKALHEATTLLQLVPLERLISHHLALEEAARGMDMSYRQEALKVIIHPWGVQ